MYYVHMFVTLFLMFGFGFLPQIGTITPVGMKVLGLFLGVIYGYSFCDIIWPSMFAFLAFGISGYTTMSGAVTQMMGHSVVFQNIARFITAGALSYYGFGKWFVRKTLGLPIFKKRPELYVWGLFVIFGLSCFLVDQIMMSLILYGIWTDICDNCGYEKGSNIWYVGFCGIMMSTILGGAMVSKGSWCLALAQSWSAVTGDYFNLGIQATMTVPATVLIITLYLVVTKFLFKIDYSTMGKFDTEKMGEESRTLRPRAKRVLVMYLTTVLLTVFGSAFPGNPLSNLVNNTLTITGMYCLCSAILLILPGGEGDGKPCINFKEIQHLAISWDVIFMCAVTIPVGSALVSDTCGVVEYLNGVLSPVFDGRTGTFIMILTIVVSLFLTNVGSNIGFGTAMIPLIAPFAMKAGVNTMYFGAAMIYMINIGMVLPGASAPAAIFHGQAALPDSKKRYAVTLTACACILVVAIPLFSGFLALFG